MQKTLFYTNVSCDFVAQGSHCEWCDKPAVQHLTALGGRHHNQAGRFCLSCAKEFARIVNADTIFRKAMESYEEIYI